VMPSAVAPSQQSATPSAHDTAAQPAHEPTPPPVAAVDSTPMPMPRLDEVLRFDVTVEWVMQRWPRVSTGLPHLRLQGYRVPLVTGTSLSDLAGSLTYYFNARQQVERITLRGATGDPRALLQLLVGRHHFTRRLTNDPGLILYEAVNADNKQVGKLSIRSSAVVKADQPYNRFEIDLVMDRGE